MNWRCLLFWRVQGDLPLIDAKREAWTVTPGDDSGITPPIYTQFGTTQAGMAAGLEHPAGPEPNTPGRRASEEYIVWHLLRGGDEQETRH